MSEAAVYWKQYTSVPEEGIDLLAEAGGIPVMGILCEGAGNLAATHSTPVAGDTNETIPAVAGQYYPILANKILADTTALPLTVFWGHGSASVVTPAPIGSPGGSASADNQDEQTALLEKIDVSTQIGSGWFPKAFKKLLFSDMTGSGIDIAALAPADMQVIGVIGSRTTANGTVIYLEASGNAPGVFVDLDWGRNYTQYGNWKTIGPLTGNTCFPMWVAFA